MNKFGDEDLNTILIGSIPKHEDLCCLLGTINFSESSSNISNKAYQCQIFKCRCLIFSVPEVIASPVLGAVQHIHIITNQDFYQCGKLAPYLDKINVKVDEPIPLTNPVYEACLRYTLLARLAPAWNQVDRYLVNGRDFLTATSPLDAIKLDIVINDSDMHVVLWPLRLRLPHVCAQDFQSPSFQSPLSWDLSSNNLTIHVLPSLNQANVLMVSSHIPLNSLFKSYKELKRHWKNSYGYRLPENEEGMLYLTVKFGRWFSESLTYPIICTRARRPVFLRQHEPQQVLLRVLADLHAKLPYICGFPFGVEATFRYALPKLNVLSEALFPANLTTIKPQIKNHEVEVKDEDDTIMVENASQPVSQYTQTQTSRLATQSNFKNCSTSPPPFLPHMSQVITSTPSRPLYVPVFTAKPKSHLYSAPSSNLSLSPSSRHPDSAPTIPKFRGTPMKPIFGLAQPPPPPSLTSFHTNKATGDGFKPRNIAPFPIFNSISGGPLIRPFNFAKGEKTLLHVPEPTSKKARNKPQVQQGLDVKALAYTRNGLAKVNTTTLIAYLRSEGVPCKVKDKKAELVAKVLTHLNLPLPPVPKLPPTHNLSQDSEG